MFRYLLLLSLTLLCFNARADEASVKKTLKKNYPQIGKIDQVYKAPFLGLYEVLADGQLLYTDEKVQFLIIGSIYDLKKGRNLTEERSRVLFAVDFKDLPFDAAVVKVKGNGKRKLAYLTDPNCGYCKKLEHELQNIDNVTLYRFFYPLFPGSEEKIRNILCSKDPNKAWEDWMLNAVEPAAATCSTQTAKVIALGKKLHVGGTPTLVFPDGTLVPGFLPAPELEKALDNGGAHE